MTIAIFTLSLVFNLLITFSWFLTDIEQIMTNKMQFMLLSILSGAIINIGILIYIFKKYQVQKRKTSITWRGFWLKLGFRKLTVYDIVLCGVFTALTIVFAYLEQFMPGLVGGGGLTFKYLGLIILGVAISPALSIIVGICGALLSLLFVGSTLIISPWSFILDYFIPMMIPGIVSILRFTITTKKSYINYLNYIIVGFLTFLGIYIIQTLSGYYIWVAMAGGPAWGNNGVVYSVVYNALSIWPFNYPLTQIIMVPTIKVALLVNKGKF
ncbi:energy-coupled thiamine transporter ThiT [Williamsoniiplasma luminosum]|nr:energy-coupled thiamine transporter ThiT [Williamsoniiplasma luminosum]